MTSLNTCEYCTNGNLIRTSKKKNILSLLNPNHSACDMRVYTNEVTDKMWTLERQSEEGERRRKSLQK